MHTHLNYYSLHYNIINCITKLLIAEKEKKAYKEIMEEIERSIKNLQEQKQGFEEFQDNETTSHVIKLVICERNIAESNLKIKELQDELKQEVEP